MGTTFISLISLFISCFILFLGNGLMNVLMPVRMELDGIGTDMIGLVQSLYYVGLLLGAIYSKNLIIRAGHIRMFAGCVSLGAASILICSLYTDPKIWGLMRLVLGFCNACAFAAMESWLSDASTKETRGKVLAIYNAVVLAGLFVGQFFMNMASPESATLFVVGGMLLTLAVIPIVLSSHAGPKVEEVSTMSLRALFRISPLGVVSCLVSGLIYSAAFNLLPVFAKEYDIVDFQLSLYVGFAILGAFLLQFPVGYLSDRFDRRTVLLCLLLISAGACITVNIMAPLGVIWAVFLSTAITCGIIACTYPLSISEAFDKLRQSEMVAAMGCMILAFSVGGIIGPYSASLVMELLGNAALFYFLALVQVLLAAFVIYRMQAREALPVEDQEHFVMQGAAIPAMVDLDPRTEYVEPEYPLSAQAETVVNVAESDVKAAVKMAKTIARTNPELSVEVAGAVAKVDGINVLDLYAAMREVVPFQILEVTRSIVTAKPDLAYELVTKLAEWYPGQVVSVAAEIGQTFPDLRMEMARVAAESAPESALEVAEYYAKILAEERDALRPADREDDTSEEDAVNIAAEIWEAAPEQALDVAATMVDAVPETAVPVAEGYMSSDLIAAAAELSRKEEQAKAPASLEQFEMAFQQQVDLVARLAEVAPEQAVDVAVAVVEAEPESAAEVAAELVSTLSTPDEMAGETEPVMQTDKTESDTVELESTAEMASRLAEAAPDQAIDVAVAVAEADPENAAEVVTEVLSTMSDSETSETDGQSGKKSGETPSETVAEQPEVSEESEETPEVSGYEVNAEMASRMADALPEKALEVAVAMVEAEPESAAEVAAGVAISLMESETQEAVESAATGVEQEDQEASSAAELVSRLAEVAPEQALDVAVAVVEVEPESAVAVAAELSGSLAEGEPDESSAQVGGEEAPQTETLDEPESEHDAAVELVQRLSEVAPDDALDMAVAVVENIPEAASDLVDMISEGDEAKDEEWMNTLDEKPRD